MTSRTVGEGTNIVLHADIPSLPIIFSRGSYEVNPKRVHAMADKVVLGATCKGTECSTSAAASTFETGHKQCDLSVRRLASDPHATS